MADVDVLTQVQTKVTQVRRRQSGQSALRSWPTFLALTLVVVAFWHLLQPRFGFDLSWEWTVGTALMVTLVGTLWLAWRQRPSPTQAALSLDRACGMQERVVTMLTLNAEQKASPAGQALTDDTKEYLHLAQVPDRFPLRQPLRSFVAPLLAIAALLIALLFPWSSVSSAAEKKKQEETKQDEPKKELQPDLSDLLKKNEERRDRVKDIHSKPLDELQQDIDKLFGDTQRMKNDKDVQQAVQDSTRMQEALQNRQDQMQGAAETRKQLENSTPPDDKEDGPASDFKKALQESNFEEAKQQLQKLNQKLQNQQMSDQERKKTEQQLADMQKRLDDIAKQTERQEALNKSNTDPETKAKEQAQIDRERQKLQDVQKMADKLKEMNQALKDKKPDDARKAMDDMAKQLDQMERQQKELDELPGAIEDMQRLGQLLNGKSGDQSQNGKQEKQQGQKQQGSQQAGKPENQQGQQGQQGEQQGQQGQQQGQQGNQQGPQGQQGNQQGQQGNQQGQQGEGQQQGQGQGQQQGQGQGQQQGQAQQGQGQGQSQGGSQQNAQPGGSSGGTNQAIPGGRRSSRANRTASQDIKDKTQQSQTDKVTVVGPGDKQEKPAPGGRREPTIVNPGVTPDDREKAMDALRQQKINPSKKDLVSDFYENPAPTKPK